MQCRIRAFVMRGCLQAEKCHGNVQLLGGQKTDLTEIFTFHDKRNDSIAGTSGPGPTRMTWWQCRQS